MQIIFHFDTQTDTIDRQTVIDYLSDSDGYSPGELEAMTDEELIAQLNENGIDEFYDNEVRDFPECIRCDVAEEK